MPTIRHASELPIPWAISRTKRCCFSACTPPVGVRRLTRRSPNTASNQGGVATLSGIRPIVLSRGALARELTACLRTGRALRVPRARVGARGKGFICEEVMISQRPAEAADRAVPGHWEGDLIIGTARSAIGTLVERTSRFTMLLHLPPLPGRDGPRVKKRAGGHRRRRGGRPRRDRRAARRAA